MAEPMLSIIVPCYNEEKNIPLIIDAFAQLVQQNPGIEVLLVNNGSTDNSALVFEALLAGMDSKFMRLITVPVNKGYGHGILAGLHNASAPVLAWTHADLQTDPADVIKAWGVYRQLNDPTVLVKGQRRNRRLAEAFFTWGMALVTRLLLKKRLHDINAQPKLFSRVFFEKIKDAAPLDFSLDVYFLYKAAEAGTIKTIDVFFGKRIHGEAKGGGSFKTRMRLIRRTFHYLWQLRKQFKTQSPS
jgi:glycosyltransferase involved in cell wall biosynthesis